MRKLLLFVSLTLCLVSLRAQPSYAFKEGYHFYLTYSIAHWCGLESYPLGETDEAYAVAWGDYSTDKFTETDAGANPDEWLDPSKAETRRVFHFAVPSGDYSARVVRNSSDAWETAQAAINEASATSDATLTPMDAIFLGLGLHTLQDSWSHEGYDPQFGHWTLTPDYPDTDVTKSLEAAGATWDAINRWKKKVHGTGCTTKFEDVAGLIQTWCAQPVNSGDTDAMNDYWRKNAEALATHSVPMEMFDGNAVWSKAFLDAAARVEKLKSRARE